MNRSDQINELAAALCKAQGQIEGAKKDSVNPHFKSAYADLAAVWEAVRGPLTANGLAVTQWLRTMEGGVEVETVLMHTSGQYMSDVLSMPVLKMDAQSVGSGASYARRYALMAALGVAAIDDDGEAAVSHKPGVPGSAGGGTDFRPATRRMQPSSANGRRMANDDAHLIDAEREKGTTSAPPPADDKTKRIAEWVAGAIATLSLSGQSVETLKQFLVDNVEKIRFLEDKHPDHHERFFAAYNAAADSPRTGVVMRRARAPRLPTLRIGCGRRRHQKNSRSITVDQDWDHLGKLDEIKLSFSGCIHDIALLSLEDARALGCWLIAASQSEKAEK